MVCIFGPYNCWVLRLIEHRYDILLAIISPVRIDVFFSVAIQHSLWPLLTPCWPVSKPSLKPSLATLSMPLKEPFTEISSSHSRQPSVVWFPRLVAVALFIRPEAVNKWFQAERYGQACFTAFVFLDGADSLCHAQFHCEASHLPKLIKHRLLTYLFCFVVMSSLGRNLSRPSRSYPLNDYGLTTLLRAALVEENVRRTFSRSGWTWNGNNENVSTIQIYYITLFTIGSSRSTSPVVFISIEQYSAVVLCEQRNYARYHVLVTWKTDTMTSRSSPGDDNSLSFIVHQGGFLDGLCGKLTYSYLKITVMSWIKTEVSK